MSKKNKTSDKQQNGNDFIAEVSSCYSIKNKKPLKNQHILYVGNHGFSEGTYRNYADGVGWVILPNGNIDCFDEWKYNNC